MYSLAQLNAMSEAEFVSALGFIYEDTPAIACQVWHYRPFPDLDTLVHHFIHQATQLSEAEQLQLICAHPDLGSRVKMAEASVQEQTGAGLNQLIPEEYERLLTLNQAYKTKFGFPFIIAVKNHTKASILDAFEQRLDHAPAVEREQAIAEIHAIAQHRLRAVIAA